MRSYLYFPLLTYCLALLSLPAQEVPAPIIDVKFTAFMWDKPLKGHIHYSSEGEDIPLNLPNLQRSPIYSYTGPTPLPFYTIEAGTDGQTIRSTVAEANIPVDMSKPLLIFIPGGSGGLDYRVAVLDDEVKDFRPGSYRFINLSSYAVKGKIGAVDVNLSKRGSTATVDTGVDEVSYEDVIFAIEQNDTWRPAFQTVWRIDPRERMLVFLTDSTKRHLGPLELKAIPQLVLNPVPSAGEENQ